MPFPRRLDFPDVQRLTESGHIPGRRLPAGRSLTEAEQKRRERGSRHAPPGHGPVWQEPRNGLPVKPYVYRGSGADAYAGEVA